METTKLAGLPAKADNKRRPKTAKRKKPNESSAGGGLTAAPSLARVDGITATSGAKSDSGIKLETSSGGGDDSGINMADTWQRNGHSADFVRQGLVDGLPQNAMTGPGSAPPPSSQDTFGPSGGGGPTPGPQSKPSFQNCGPPQGLGGPPPPRGLLPPNGLPMMDGPGPGGMPNFMPQQSQVFVFSTEMANRAAEAVERGLCRTIVDYHLDQPMTRQFMQSLSSGGPHPSQHFMGPPFGPPDGPPHMGDPSLGPPQPGDVGGPDMGGGSALANVELWVQQQNATLQEGPFSPSFGPSSGPMPPVHRSRSNGDASNGLGPPRCCPGPHNHPGGEFGPGAGGDPMFGPQPPPGYVHDHPHMMRGGPGRVQDENLTPEQLQRREEQLAHLQKIKQMLFPEKQGPGFEGGPPQRYPGGPPGGMFGRPGGPPPDDMMPHHHMMGGPPQRFMHHGGPPGMMVPPGGMIDQPGPPDGMMMMGGMGPPFGGGEPGLPPNWEMMTNEEKEWFRLQQEYYMEQRQKRQMQLQQMGGGPPPPGYFSDMPRQPPGRASGPLSPVSPSFNGPSPHDPQGFFFQGQPGMNFPPGRPPNFPPNGPVGGPPNFNPDFGPHPDGGNFPPYGNPMMMQEPGGPFPGGRFPPVCGGKPKRKRGGNVPPCMPGPGDRPGDDIFRHLQPAPSPQQFCSLNLFDGQELTITKQLNLAYQEPTSSSPSQQTCTPPPVTTAPSRKKKKSNNDMRIKSENIEGGAGNALSPVGQLAQESNELDRPAASPSVSGMRPAGGSGPITSATLASLQRGVESLSDRIQADMLRGGPFGAVQMPEPDEVGDADERRSNAGGMPQDPSRNNAITMRGPQDNPMMQGGGDPTGDRSPPSGCGSIKQDPSSLLSPQTSGIDGMLAASQSNRYTTSGGPSSVQSPGAMIGNASVQIEPRAPNTIQYLPTRPPTSSDLDHMVAMERQGGMPPENQEMFRQMGGPGYCPNGAPMLPPGYDGPIPPGYNGPMARFDGPGYGGPPLSPGGIPQHRGGPMQFHGDMMFPDGGPMPFPGDGPMMHSGAGGPMPYHGGRPMFYRGGGGMPPQGGPMYRGPNPQMMMQPEFHDGGGPERHGQLMAMGGGMRPNGSQMMMMGSGRPVLPPDQPPIPANPPPARSRTESRSKKSKDAKRRAADAAAAARQNPPVCEENAMMLGGRPDPRGGGGPMPPFGGPGQMQGPPMGFPPSEGGVMMMERMRPGPGPMMMAGDGSPGMMRHPEGMMMGPEEFEMMRQGSAMIGPDGRMMIPRGGGGAMRNEQMMMMMKGGMRPGDGDLMPPGMMMQMGPRGEPDMRNDTGMMGPVGEMRPGSGMMGLPPGMMGPNEMRQGPGGMMEMRPGSGMMMSGDGRPGSGMMGPGGEIMRPGSALMGQGDGRPASGMLLPNDMNQIQGSMGSCDPRPGSGMVVMSPREDGSGGDGSGRNRQHGNGKGHMQQNSEGPPRPDSVGKRLEAEMMQGMGPGGGMMMQGGGHRPGSKMMMPGSLDGEMRPSSVAGMEMMDGGMRPGSAIMMGMGGDGRMRGPGPDMMGPDGGMRPGSALMMGMGPGDMRSRQEMMMMGMDPMEMAMRPGSEIMMAMGPGDGGMRPGGGPVMMSINPGNDGSMRPGPDMMSMGPGEVRMRPGSAAMMMGMVPGSEGQMMGMGPNDGGMIMMGPGGESMAMMGMNPGDFDPRGCPPEMMNSHRMGPMGPRMMSPADMRYDGAGPMVPMRMNRPRGELDFRMMGGMDPGMRSGPYGGPGMRNGSVCPPDRQMMMMMMNAGPNSGGPMQPGDFGPGMGGPQMGPSDGAQFQQFQQQLYATKGHHPQQGPPSPMMMMGGGGNFSGFDQVPNGPPIRFGPP